MQWLSERPLPAALEEVLRLACPGGQLSGPRVAVPYDGKVGGSGRLVCFRQMAKTALSVEVMALIISAWSKDGSAET